MPKHKHQTSKSSSVRRRKFSPLRFVFWLILLVLAGVVIYGAYRFLFDKSYNLPELASAETSSSSSAPVAAPASSSSDTAADSSSVPASSATDNPDGKTPEKYDGASANAAPSLTGNLTYAAVSGDQLVLRTNIDQYLSSGSCTLSLVNGDSQLTVSAAILPEAASSTCEGFDIPLSSLTTFSGETSIQITLTSGDRSGIISGRVNL